MISCAASLQQLHNCVRQTDRHVTFPLLLTEANIAKLERYSTWLVRNSLSHTALVKTTAGPSSLTSVRKLSAAPPPPPPTESAYHESYLNGSSGLDNIKT